MNREKNIFDKIGSLIPGYIGYAERSSRRKCDKLIRDKIADEINYFENILNLRLKKEIKNKNLDVINDIDECRQKLNIIADKIQYSPYGTSSFFSESQIKENELDLIYEYDKKLLIAVNNIKNDIQNSNLSDILSYIMSITLILTDRNNFIKEHK